MSGTIRPGTPRPTVTPTLPTCAMGRSSLGDSRSSGRSTCSVGRTSPSRTTRTLRAPVPGPRPVRPASPCPLRLPLAWGSVYRCGQEGTSLRTGVPEVPGYLGDGPGNNRLYAGGGEDPLGLAQRGAEGARKYPQDREVLLERRYADRQHLGAGGQRGDAPFELCRAVREPDDLGADLRLKSHPGAAQAQPGAERGERGNQCEGRAYDDDYGEKCRQSLLTLPWRWSPLQTFRPCYKCPCAAGWSSQVARRAHNPKVTGSNPVPATNRDRPRRAGPFPFQTASDPIYTVIFLPSLVLCNPLPTWSLSWMCRQDVVSFPSLLSGSSVLPTYRVFCLPSSR